ncbi:MAG: serine hydrolase domain-containing protein [Paraglaciecola sp.]|uniref:serine hydrolase domain-containing protein n=1 Tax=Paraglaciecola sp. TaxID=1920173 RepID=UPI003264C763
MKEFVDTLLRDTQQLWLQPGIAMSVVQGASSFHSCVGVCRSDGRVFVDEKTSFALASCSKPFIVVAILILQNRGLLRLDDPVKQYIKELEFSEDGLNGAVTIRDLMCNRLGLLPSEGRHRQVASDRTNLIARLKDQPFRHAFKEHYAYCTDGFTLLGEIMVRVLKLDLDSCFEQLIFAPLEMENTNVSHQLAQQDGKFASPHLWQDGRLAPIPWVYEDHVAAPAGGINSTAQDMLKWMRFLMTGKSLKGVQVLALDQLRLARIPHMDDIGPFSEHELSQAMGQYKHLVENEAYALGWYTHTYLGARIVYHTGSIDGFRSLTALIEGHDFAVSILANGDNPFLPRMLFQMLVDNVLGVEIADWKALFLEHQTLLGGGKSLHSFAQSKLSKDEQNLLAPLIGKFKDNTGFGLAEIKLVDDSIVMTVGSLKFYLRPIDKDSFEAYKKWPYCTGAQFTARIIPNSASDAIGFTTSQRAHFIRMPVSDV